LSCDSNSGARPSEKRTTSQACTMLVLLSVVELLLESVGVCNCYSWQFSGSRIRLLSEVKESMRRNSFNREARKPCSFPDSLMLFRIPLNTSCFQYKYEEMVRFLRAISHSTHHLPSIFDSKELLTIDYWNRREIPLESTTTQSLLSESLDPPEHRTAPNAPQPSSFSKCLPIQLIQSKLSSSILHLADHL
jgi:hypothetical protein